MMDMGGSAGFSGENFYVYRLLLYCYCYLCREYDNGEVKKPLTPF
jgi:hypothetical protein